MGRSADDENLGIAFGLVIGAGAATGLGAAVVFVPALVRLASRKTLAAALGLSAGVMTYVSFVEILNKSSAAFEDEGHDPDKAYIYATLCFFAGVLLMVALNQTVTWLLGGHHHHPHHGYDHHQGTDTGRLSSISHGVDQNNNQNNNQRKEEEENKEEMTSGDIQDVQKQQQVTATTSTNPHSLVEPVCACHSEDPAGDLQHLQHMAEEIENYEHTHHHHWEGTQQQQTKTTSSSNNNNNGDSDEDNNDDDEEIRSKEETPDQQENKKLMRMSLNTALAIGLHNFPEGLATFVAALSDPSVGAVLAMAIAIHNVPEGLCVAMPVYYATGDKMKAFGWAMVSGIAEPIAALLGWAVLANSFSDQSYGILFGLVSGMMVIISARELLPTAHRYDPEDSVVTYSFMAGMAIMAISLVLFLL